MEAIKNRYEFTVFFDVENGNPNGDPDAGNMPRVDPETQMGLVTDVCIKRKIRNFVGLYKESEPHYNILVNADSSLASHFEAAYEANNLKKKQKDKASDNDIETAKDYMCRNYYDVRTFGAVMNVSDNRCGTVRGPVQLEFAHSLDPISPQNLTITRLTDVEDTQTQMGKKNIVPYGLYRVDGYVSAMLAQKTGFSDEDLELLWTAIINMFEHDRSAARGKMCVRKLFVFKHDSALGNAPAHILFDKIKATKNADVAVPRSFADYTVTVDNHMPDGVTFIEKL